MEASGLQPRSLLIGSVGLDAITSAVPSTGNIVWAPGQFVDVSVATEALIRTMPANEPIAPRRVPGHTNHERE